MARSIFKGFENTIHCVVIHDALGKYKLLTFALNRF